MRKVFIFLMMALLIFPCPDISTQGKRVVISGHVKDASSGEPLAGAVVFTKDKKSGVWFQVMDEPGRDGNYLESTCSAMFTYALLKAARKGYVSEKYRDAGIKAYKGMIEKFIKVNADKTISLTQCCSVAGLGPAVTPEVEAAMKKVNPKGSVKENKKRDGSYEYYLSEPIRDNDAKGVGPFIWASLEMEMMGYTTEEK